MSRLSIEKETEPRKRDKFAIKQTLAGLIELVGIRCCLINDLKAGQWLFIALARETTLSELHSVIE